MILFVPKLKKKTTITDKKTYVDFIRLHSILCIFQLILIFFFLFAIQIFKLDLKKYDFCNFIF